MIQLVAVLFFVWVGYGLALVIYRLWLSPLAQFPGPKLAAATLWYEIYHDAVRWGQYTFEIEKMHKKYGNLDLSYDDHSNDSQALSSELALMNCMSMTLISTKYCTRAIALGTSTTTLQPSLVRLEAWSRSLTTITTVSCAPT